MRIVHKGLILTALPLLCQLVATGVLLNQLHHAQVETARVSHARRILREANALAVTYLELGLCLTRYCAPLYGPIGPETIQLNRPLMTRFDLQLNNAEGITAKLRDLSSNDATERTEFSKFDLRMQTSLRSLKQASFLMHRLDGGAPNREIAKELRSRKNALEAGLDEWHAAARQLAAGSKALDDASVAAFTQNNQGLYRALLLNLVTSVLMAAALTAYFSADILSRLRVIKDNSMRLVKGQPLLPADKGSDEINMLDHSFRQMAHDLNESERKERALLDNVQDVICSFDMNGKFQRVTSASERLWGYEPTQLVGKPLVELILPEGQEQLANSFHKLASTALPVVLENRVLCADGSIRDVMWSLSSGSSTDAIYGIAYDITERRALERLKQEFTAMVSHDLRSPLTSVIAVQQFVKLGVYGPVPDTAQAAVATTIGHTEKLLTLVNNLLDIEELESRTALVNRTAAATAFLIQSAIDQVAPLVKTRSSNLRVEPTDTSVLVETDSMVRVLRDLLTNAINRSPDASTVTVSTLVVANSARISVTDSGSPIPSAEVPLIFHRLKAGEAGRKAGAVAALQLEICKLIVEKNGGQIGVFSEPSKGNTFWISLPLAVRTDGVRR